MPSSRHNHISLVITVVRRLQPRSILDVGVGFGKWGHLFREYLDIVPSEVDPERYYKGNWKVVIDGIEGFGGYITPAHEFLYSNLFIGDMREKLPELGRYDVIFLGDVIEHVEKGEGLAFLRKCAERANKAVIVTTPAKWVPQEAICGNSLEIHRSSWRPNEFRGVGDCATMVAENDILIAIIAGPDLSRQELRSLLPRNDALSRYKGYVQRRAGALLRAAVRVFGL